MPLSVADQIEIQGLLARYNHAIDSGDASAWAATFAADGTFTSGGRTRTGTEELQAFAADFAARMPGSRHWANNLVIDGDGDRATMHCYLQLLKTGGGPATLVTTARYEDTLRRVDGAWKFASRTVVPD